MKKQPKQKNAIDFIRSRAFPILYRAFVISFGDMRTYYTRVSTLSEAIRTIRRSNENGLWDSFFEGIIEEAETTI